MTDPRSAKQLARLAELHPLLAVPPPEKAETSAVQRSSRAQGERAPARGPSDWAARQAEIKAAIAADAETAARQRARAAVETPETEDTGWGTFMGFAIACLLALIGLFILFQLVDGTRLEDCLLAHRHNCEALFSRGS